MTKEEKQALVPIWEKTLLTIDEASAYTGIGTQSLRRISEEYGSKLVLWVGNKRMFKRKQLEEYLDKEYSI